MFRTALGLHLLRIACIALTLIGSFQESARAADEPFNLVIIQTDEHHFSTLGCYGGTIVETPHIDSIAAAGARCTSFYATTPVCSPSRAALVSGLYPQKTAVVTNNIPLDDSIVTFAELLRRNGYATGFAGKWHLDGDGKPQWAPERQFGFEDNRFMFNRGHWKKLEDTPDGPRVGGRNQQGQPNYDLNGADETTFTTDWLCDKAIDFIDAHAQGDCAILGSVVELGCQHVCRLPGSGEGIVRCGAQEPPLCRRPGRQRFRITSRNSRILVSVKSLIRSSTLS